VWCIFVCGLFMGVVYFCVWFIYGCGVSVVRSKLCIPHLKKGKNPHILNISPPINLNPRWFANHCGESDREIRLSDRRLG